MTGVPGERKFLDERSPVFYFGFFSGKVVPGVNGIFF
jgi:hypothetical protein